MDALRELHAWFAADPGRLFWVYFGAVLLHEFEEHVWPGGFREWFNRTLHRSHDPHWPLTVRGSLVADTALGASAALLAALLGTRAAWFGAGMVLAGFVNAWFHLSMVLVTGAWVPGAATALLLHLPLTAFTLAVLLPADLLGAGGLALAVLFAFAVNDQVFRWPRKRAAERAASREG